MQRTTTTSVPPGRRRVAFRVAHVTTVGLSLRYLLLSELARIREEGYAVAGLSAPDEEVAALEAAGIPHFAVPMTRRMTPLADLRTLVELVRVMRRERFDIVHTHTPKAGLLGQLAARLAGVPVVVNTLHGFYFHAESPQREKLLFGLLEWVAARCSDRILSQNGEDIATAVRLGIAPRSRLARLGNGIDLARFDRRRLDPARLAELRRSLGLEERCRVVGFVGRLVEEKGILELFEAAREVRREVSDVRFLVIGPTDDSKPDALRPEAAARHGVEELFVFTGLRTDLPELYALMDVFVLPSHREGFPRTPMEAAAMGIPSVVTDIRGCRETVIPGENGLLVPRRDAAALARALLELLRDPELRRRMGAAGRRIAEQRFDEHRVHERVLDTYRELLVERGLALRPRDPASRRAPERTEIGRSFYLRHGKRWLDLGVTVPALLVAAPLIAGSALLVRATLGAPVFFRQPRPGLGGRVFEILKLRTMSDARGPDGALLPDEQRLGRVGKVLRQTSLDELPTLLNVLKGELSLVGPRPLLVQYLGRYTERQARRHAVMPGLTGLAQVKGRNLLSWEEKFEADLWYVEHASLWLDLEIILLTLARLVAPRGISAGGHVTMPEFMGSPEAAVEGPE